jgi:hypothetical protein
VGKDAETAKARWEGDDVVIGEERAGRGAEDEQRAVEHLIELIPAAEQIVRLEVALDAAEVVLDALPEEEKSCLEGKRRELGKKEDLFVDLLLEKSKSELFRADRRPEKLDAVASDVVDVVDGRLGCVKGEGGAVGGEEVGDVSDGVGIVGKDDNVVEVSQDDGRRGFGSEGGEMGAKMRESVANGQGKEERGEGIALTNAGGRVHTEVLLICTEENDGRGFSVRPPSCPPELRTVLLRRLGHVGSMDGVVGVLEVELASVLPRQRSLGHHLHR